MSGTFDFDAFFMKIRMEDEFSKLAEIGLCLLNDPTIAPVSESQVKEHNFCQNAERVLAVMMQLQQKYQKKLQDSDKKLALSEQKQFAVVQENADLKQKVKDNETAKNELQKMKDKLELGQAVDEEKKKREILLESVLKITQEQLEKKKTKILRLKEALAKKEERVVELTNWLSTDRERKTTLVQVKP